MTEEIRQMNQLINDARELIGEMKAQYELNKEQLKSMQARFDEQSDLFEKKVALISDAWKAFRNITIVLFTVIIVPMIIGGFTIKGQVDSLEKHVEEEDNVEVKEMINSFDVMIEQNEDMFEGVGADKDAILRYSERTKEGITRSVDSHRTPEK